MLKNASLPKTRLAMIRPATDTSASSSSVPASRPSQPFCRSPLECVTSQLNHPAPKNDTHTRAHTHTHTHTTADTRGGEKHQCIERNETAMWGNRGRQQAAARRCQVLVGERGGVGGGDRVSFGSLGFEALTGQVGMIASRPHVRETPRGMCADT